jgi:hypothetical protein
MKKAELKQLATDADDIIGKVMEAVRNLTAENPLILFDREKADVDEIHNYPSGFNVDKYGTYEQGAIMKVEGNAVTLFLTGDNWGQEYHTELQWISFDSVVQLLTYLEERSVE